MAIRSNGCLVEKAKGTGPHIERYQA